MSNEITLLFFKISGISPSTILWASPSIIAVFPTPGSPMRQGLFFVLLHNIWIILSISSFLPITGSIFPSKHFLVISVEKPFKVGVLLLFLYLLFTAL